VTRYSVVDPTGFYWMAGNFWTQYAGRATLFVSEDMAYRQCCLLRQQCTDDTYAAQYRTVRFEIGKDLTITKGTD